MKRITLILSLFIVFASWQGGAQVLSESFDSPTLPTGWTNEYVNKTENWHTVTENMFGLSPHSGARMAEFMHSNFGAITKLVTPSMNLSAVANPQVNFFFANLKVGVVDELRIYYKTSPTGAWTQIGDNYNHEHNDWTEVTLNLPEPSSTYYIAFEAKFLFGGGVDLDDVTVAAGPSCLAPINLVAKNLTTTSAKLMWTEFGTATSWVIEYGPAGFLPGTGTTVVDNNGTIGETISGLSAGTKYDFYVKSDCGAGDTSAWAGPKQFSTTCEPIASFPWNEDFSGILNGEIPNCWIVVDNNDDARTFQGDESFGVGGSESVGMYTDFNNGNNDDYLILPPFNLNENQSLTFQTLLLNAAQPDVFEVVLSTTENDIEDFTTVVLPLTTVSTAGPTSHTIDLSAYSGIVHLAVHIPNSSTDGYYIYFDDFVMVDLFIACPPVTDLNANPYPDGTVMVSWTSAGTESQWIVEYGLPGFTPGTGTTVTVNGDPETLLTGLESNTSYEFYVTAVCGPTESSILAGPVTFRTENTSGCGHSQSSNNFEDAYLITAGGEYSIADDFVVNASTINFSLETVRANLFVSSTIATASISFYEDNNGIPGTQIGSTIENLVPTSQNVVGTFGAFNVVEAVMDLPTAINFTRGASNQAATYWVQIKADPTDIGSPVGWEVTSVNRIGNSAAVRYLNEPWTNNLDGKDMVFTLEGTCTLVECPEPTNLSVMNITENSAYISWNPIGTETEWEIEYGPAGFALGSGTVITDNDGIAGETISGLQAGNYYEFYVTALCGSGDSNPAGPKGFSTLCGGAITAFPFYESFEDTSGTRSCWTNEYVEGIETDWNYVTANGNRSITPRTGELMAQFKTESTGDKTKLVTPALDLTVLTNPQLTFYFANTNWIADHDELRIFYKTSANGTWTQIGANYTTEHLVWTQVILDLPNPSSEYYVAFEGKSNFGRGIDVDDVMIANAPTCMQPLNLVANHMTQDSVELSWDVAPTATNGYTWYIFEADADPETATAIATGTVPTGTTSVVVDGLTPVTVFDFYVKSNCDSGEMSFLAGPTTFKTAAIPPVCGDKFYDTGGANGDYQNNEFVTWIISPDVEGDHITVTFTQFNVETAWDALYVHNGPDASYPLIPSGNGPTANFPAGGYYGVGLPGPFTSTHSSGALTFVFMSDSAFPYSGWVADVTCESLGVENQTFENFTFYPNPVDNTLNLKANSEIQTVIVYNLLGQEVLKALPNNSTPTLEVGNLPTGAYLMKVTIDGNEKAYRLLKK